MMLQYKLDTWQSIGDAEVQIANSRAMAFGIGVFETMYVYEGHVEFCEAHFHRLSYSCKTLGLPLELTLEAFKNGIEEIVKEHNQSRAVLKIMVSEMTEDTAIFLSLKTFPYCSEQLDLGISLLLGSQKTHSTQELLRHKTCNYWANMRLRTEALSQGYFDGIWTNEKDILTECAAGNLLFMTREQLLTAPLSEGLLPGIMRSEVMKAASQLNVECVENGLIVSNLKAAEFIFYTNSLVGLVLVNEISGPDGVLWHLTEQNRDFAKQWRAKLINQLNVFNR